MIICPDYPPSVSGLAGHTFQFIENLKIKTSDKLHLITSCRPNNVPIQNINDLHCCEIQHWNFKGIFQAYKYILQIKPTHLFLQWVPYLYSPKGINFWPILLMLMIKIRLPKTNIEIFFHELWYPYLGTIKSLILHLIHRVMTKMLLFIGHTIYTTTQANQNHLSKMTRSKVFQLYIGSGIQKEQIESYLLPANFLQNPFVVLFGDFHPSKNMPFLVNQLIKICPKLKLNIIHIGVSKDEYIKLNLLSNLPDFLHLTGKISNQQVAYLLAKAYALITYFSDGATTRRSSLISALEFDLPAITTISENTDNILKSYPNIWWAPTDLDSYSKELEHFLLHLCNPAENKNPLGDHALTWNSILTRYIETRGTR